MSRGYGAASDSQDPKGRRSSACGSTSRELEVYLLGPPRVAWGGAVLSIPRRQVRAVLYCLAAEPEPIPREGLCFSFWPDDVESEARRNLTQVLTHLRRALTEPDLVLTSGDRAGLDPPGHYMTDSGDSD